MEICYERKVMEQNVQRQDPGCFSFTGCGVIIASIIIIIAVFGSQIGGMFSRCSRHIIEEDERRYEAATAYVGTYVIGNNYGTLSMYNDKTVRIKIGNKTYAGYVEERLYNYDYWEINLTESIPLKWYWGLEVDWTNTLYVDAQQKYLYFSYTAYKAKDERKRWEITKVDSNNSFEKSPQKRTKVIHNDTNDNSYGRPGVDMSASEMVEIGEQYEKGQGREKDPQKAFYYYEKAAKTGDPTGLNKMGNMYSLGIGCTRNPATAFYYYKQSAEKGNMYAQYNLANCYWAGSGVEDNKEIAIMWFRRSAAQGYKPARNFLQNIGEE